MTQLLANLGNQMTLCILPKYILWNFISIKQTLHELRLNWPSLTIHSGRIEMIGVLETLRLSPKYGSQYHCARVSMPVPFLDTQIFRQ